MFVFRLGSAGDLDGAYLMSHSATGGDMPNNYRFSPCSLRLMYPVLVHKGACLRRHEANRCGNQVVEAGEECDCGNGAVCGYNDPCCTPSDADPRGPDPPCTVARARGKACSPLASGVCCSGDCQVVRDPWKVCDQRTECHDRSLCDGEGGRCPRAVAKPNGTSCGGGARFCEAGQCSGSLCRRHGFLLCRCPDPPADRCKLCCRANSPGSECLPAAEALHLVGERGSAIIYLVPGEPCGDSLLAVCDEGHACVAHLSVAHAASLLDEDQYWLANYWPYLLGLALSALVALLVFNWGTFHLKDAHTRSVHYGKLTAIFKIATGISLRTLRDIAISRYAFERFEKKVVKGTLPVCYLDAVSRLRTFFPTCPLSHLLSTVLMATSEDVVVRVLLAQGFALRRFMPKLADSEFAHLAHLLPRGLAEGRGSVDQHASDSSASIGSESLLGLFNSGSWSDVWASGSNSSRNLARESVSAWVGMSASTHYGTSAPSCSFVGGDGAESTMHWDRSLTADSQFYASYLQHFKKELMQSREIMRHTAKASAVPHVYESVVYGRTKSGSEVVADKKAPGAGEGRVSGHAPQTAQASKTSSEPGSMTVSMSLTGSMIVSMSSSDSITQESKPQHSPNRTKSKEGEQKTETVQKLNKEPGRTGEQWQESDVVKPRAENLLESGMKQTEQELINESDRIRTEEETLKGDAKDREEELAQTVVSESQKTAMSSESDQQQTASLWWLFSHPSFGVGSSKEIAADTDQLYSSLGADVLPDRHLDARPTTGSEPGEGKHLQAGPSRVHSEHPPSDARASAVYTKAGRAGDDGHVFLEMQPSTSKQPGASARATAPPESSPSQGPNTLLLPTVSQPPRTLKRTHSPSRSARFEKLTASQHKFVTGALRYINRGTVDRKRTVSSTAKGAANADKRGHASSKKSARTEATTSRSQVRQSSPEGLVHSPSHYLDLEPMQIDQVSRGMDFVDVHMMQEAQLAAHRRHKEKRLRPASSLSSTGLRAGLLAGGLQRLSSHGERAFSSHQLRSKNHAYEHFDPVLSRGHLQSKEKRKGVHHSP